MKQIQQFNKYGERVAEYDDVRGVFRVTGIASTTVQDCLNKKQATAGGFFFVYKRNSITHNLDDRKLHKLVHLYQCKDGINIHTLATITLGDMLLYRGKKYMIGKADDMRPAVQESETVSGCNYYEFTIREVS